ncbi:hypothetical protein GUJ93_ZPchr0013g34331 [Zizania palustris]|uniref:Uncharacterized protein n=1 Tax=Zizania palustris TaxID=103762 RepID=A0A8J6C0C9_ZIZPA|nr:hypothetical protein GUJ93_ZPchr0013g34331 [Zizania palustris]
MSADAENPHEVQPREFRGPIQSETYLDRLGARRRIGSAAPAPGQDAPGLRGEGPAPRVDPPSGHHGIVASSFYTHLSSLALFYLVDIAVMVARLSPSIFNLGMRSHRYTLLASGGVVWSRCSTLRKATRSPTAVPKTCSRSRGALN